MAKTSRGKAQHNEEEDVWHVDDVSPEAAAIASQAAERARVPLGVWLRDLIRETARREKQERAKRRALSRREQPPLGFAPGRDIR